MASASKLPHRHEPAQETQYLLFFTLAATIALIVVMVLLCRGASSPQSGRSPAHAGPTHKVAADLPTHAFAYDGSLSVSDLGICTKPLARRGYGPEAFG
jgi:hypothetical protein